ncbi:MAG: NAD(P)H-hydrate dehydratase [Candidatus Thermoplasmatota archaeon]
MPTLTPAEARRLDLNAEELGISVERLMGNAGKALAKVVRRRLPKGARAVFLCGKGNNGGDGFAAAADLQQQGLDVLVVLAEPAARIATPAARVHFRRLAKGSVERWTGRPRATWGKARVIVDCLLGSGLSGAPRPPYAAMIRWANAQRRHARLIACDVPSGLGSPTAFSPHETVTFHARKHGMTAANSGRIQVATIGIPRAADHDIGIGDLDLAYRRPAWDSHKGDNGIVLVIGGNVPLVGAPHYCAMGALRTGADLVHIATPEAAAKAMRAWSPLPIVHGTEPGDHFTPISTKGLEDLMDLCTTVLIGPGLGTRANTRTFAAAALAAAARRGLPIVVDADALDALDDDLLARHGHRMVLTPHAREFLDLAGAPATPANVHAYARKHGVTVLRKSSVDVVSDGTRTRECRRGHPTLTVGGTGDVLAGITGALLAKGAPPFEAACAASYLLKTAGEVAASMRSYGASALDVAEAIPSVLLRLP